MNGGMQRCFHVMHQLTKISTLTLIIKQDKASFLLCLKKYPSFTGVNIISTKAVDPPKDFFSLFPAKLQKALRFRWYTRQWFDSADSNFLEYYALLKSLLKKRFDLVILETPAPSHPAKIIRRLNRDTRIIYDAHNVDSNLEKALIANRKIRDVNLKLIERSERLLFKTVGEAFTCSENDRIAYNKINKGRLKISVIPNGVEINKCGNDPSVRSQSPQFLLFCGFLGSHANSEGIFWFYKSIWPQIKKLFSSLKVIILGSGEIPVSLENLKKDPDIIFTGKVQEVRPFYERSAVAVVPLKTGSGTRLKILEAMSSGVAVVSTTVGAEGIDYSDGTDMLIADDEQTFAEKVIFLLNDKEQRLKIQQNAFNLVKKKYDWNIVGEKLAEIIYG